MKLVTKHTRAGKRGRWIGCPECHIGRFNVGNFSWYALKCMRCKAYVPKLEWFDLGLP